MSDTLQASFNEAIQGSQVSLTDTQAAFTAYSDLKKSQTGTEGLDPAQKSIQEKQMALRELNRIEDTLNQQYLDFKAQPPQKTFFARLGLTTTQDWTLAFFFLSFGFMMVMLTIVLSAASKSPLRAAGFFLGLTSMSAFILALILRAAA